MPSNNATVCRAASTVPSTLLLSSVRSAPMLLGFACSRTDDSARRTRRAPWRGLPLVCAALLPSPTHFENELHHRAYPYRQARHPVNHAGRCLVRSEHTGQQLRCRIGDLGMLAELGSRGEG